MPAVTVIMPVYNAAPFLKEAIECVLAQTYSDLTLLLIDDGSTDGSEAVISSFDDPRIRYVKNGQNLGLIKTLNRGIAMTETEFVARLDADDLTATDRLALQMEYMFAHPETGVCGTWYENIDKEGHRINTVHQPDRNELIKPAFLFNNPFMHSSLLIRTELLKKNPFSENYPHLEDYELWFRLSRQTRMVNLPRVMASYRWHGSNVSTTFSRTQQDSCLRLVKEILAGLGIDPTPEELEIHRKLSFLQRGKTHFSGPELKRASAWLKKIAAQNKMEHRYNPQALNAVLWFRWIIVCTLSGQWKKALCSPVLSYSPAVWKYLIHLIRINRKRIKR